MALVMPNGNPQPMNQGQFQAPQYQDARNQLGQAYQTYLGRPMTDADFASQTNQGRNFQQKNINWALGQIQGSEEAQAYRNRPQPQKQETAIDNVPQNVPQNTTQPYAPQNTGGGGQAAPGVPQIYAQRQAPSISSQYAPQQIRDFAGRQINVPDYTKTVFSQFLDPTNRNIQSGRDNVLENLLANPESLSQQWQDQMFEGQKDQALGLAKQFGLDRQQGLVGRGIGLGGGSDLAAQQEIQSDLASQLLGGRRDIATQAALQNRADRLNALSAAEQGLSGDISRGSSIFQNLLAGQGAQAGENQFAARFGLEGSQAQAGNERDNYAAYLAGRNLQGSENRAAEQFRQSAYGLSEQSRQSDRAAALQDFMARNNADLGWANYGLSADDQFLQYLSGL